MNKLFNKNKASSSHKLFTEKEDSSSPGNENAKAKGKCIIGYN